MLPARTTSNVKGKVGGFTLFEVVVVICLIVMLYMIAEQRLNDIPAAAERAAFNAVLAQIKIGVNLETFALLTSNQRQRLEELEGSNPMDFFLEQPGSYEGEVENTNDPGLKRRSWYFERPTGQLVYLVGNSSVEAVNVEVAGVSVNTGKIQFRVVGVYDEPEETSGEQAINQSGSGRKWQGILLQEVFPYEWLEQDAVPVDVSG